MDIIVFAAVLLFDYSCLITWFYYAEKSKEYFFSELIKIATKVIWLFCSLPVWSGRLVLSGIWQIKQTA